MPWSPVSPPHVCCLTESGAFPPGRCGLMWNQHHRKAQFHPSMSLRPRGAAAPCSWQSVSLPVFLLQPEVKVSISQFMSYVHMSVKEMSKTYLAVERRYNYTTPKTFLEQIKLYQNLLSLKRRELTAKIDRLENGLRKLQSTASQVPARSITSAPCPQRVVTGAVRFPSPLTCSISPLVKVDDLKARLAIQEEELKVKNESADKLIHVVGIETEKVSKEKAIADEEELKVQAINRVCCAKPAPHRSGVHHGTEQHELCRLQQLTQFPHLLRTWLRSSELVRLTWQKRSRRS